MCPGDSRTILVSPYSTYGSNYLTREQEGVMPWLKNISPDAWMVSEKEKKGKGKEKERKAQKVKENKGTAVCVYLSSLTLLPYYRRYSVCQYQAVL